MNAKEFLHTKLDSVVRVLQKPIRTVDDRVLLKYLLGTMEDLREYTANFNE
jgi:hypothetical protein